MRLTVMFLAAVVLTGCASTQGPDRAHSYSNEYERLNDDCVARGGILAATGPQTGRPQTENACIIRGGPSDRLRQVEPR